MKGAPAAARPIAVGIWPNRLLLGRGAIDALPPLLADLGASRVVVVCGRTVGSGPLLARVRGALGGLCCGVYDRVAAHTPLAMVRELAEMVRTLEADAVVTVGGGSAIDAGKGIVLLEMTAGELEPYAVRYGADGAMEHRRLPRSPLLHVAVPTTSGSASEVMPTAGIRDPQARKKMLFWDDALIPDAVILDPEMTVHTGPALTAASGMTAVARCVESLYSRSRNPLAEGLALHALRLLAESLPVAIERPDDLDARYAAQVACSMSGIAAINSMVSVVHALGHVVGGRYGLQHGVSHAILLAPAMRALIETVGPRRTLVLEALGGSPCADAAEAGRLAADRVDALVGRLGLARRLAELGIPEADVPELAAQGAQDYMMANMPRPMSVAEIEGLLRSAW